MAGENPVYLERLGFHFALESPWLAFSLLGIIVMIIGAVLWESRPTDLTGPTIFFGGLVILLGAFVLRVVRPPRQIQLPAKVEEERDRRQCETICPKHNARCKLTNYEQEAFPMHAHDIDGETCTWEK